MTQKTKRSVKIARTKKIHDELHIFVTVCDVIVDINFNFKCRFRIFKYKTTYFCILQNILHP